MPLGNFVPAGWWNKKSEEPIYKPVYEPVEKSMGSYGDTIFTEEEMNEYGIRSIQTVSEATFAPRLLIKLNDGRQISSAMSRDMLQDIRAYSNIDTNSILRSVILQEIGRERLPKKEIKRVYSDLDPYGEEEWEK